MKAPTVRIPVNAVLLFAAPGLLWVLFSIYWSIAAKNSSPAMQSELRASRRIHEILINVALLLIFIPVSGMTARFLPSMPWLSAVGLAIQAAFVLLAVWARHHLGAQWSGEITIKVITN